MSGKVFVLLSVLAISHAVPVWLDTQVPNAVIIDGQSAALVRDLNPRPYVHSYNNPQYTSAVSSASNFGQRGSAVSLAQTGNNYGQALAAAQNNNPGLWSSQSALASAQSQSLNRPYESALSSAQSSGLGLGSAISSANSAPGSQSAISLASRQSGPLNYGTAVSAAQNSGAYRTSLAEAVQRNGNLYQNSGASSINGPGLQAANAQSFQVRV